MLLGRVGLVEAPETLVGDLGIGKQQLIEIAKSLAKDVKLMILDEPTASLNERDSDTLLNLMLELKAKGVTSIIISHKLNEISRVADSITVIRDGSTVDVMSYATGEVSEPRIVKAMVGRELADRYPRREPKLGETMFEIRDWRVVDPAHHNREAIRSVNLKVRRGEVVGISGLMGSGRTELALSVFGRLFGKHVGGTVHLNGKEIDTSTVSRAIGHGVAYVTEDRKGAGWFSARASPGTSHLPTCRVYPGWGSWSTITRYSTSPRIIARSCGSAVTMSCKRSAISPAATSRRWC